ncbi:hypothetical protein ACVGOW_11050 [Pseudonocardia saturnea]
MILRRTLLTALAATALLGGCAAPTPTAPTPTAPAPAVADPAPAVGLPWPARSAAEAAGLQQAVDGGAQPWLLDPAELALSYATAAHGWADAGITVDGETVQVTGPDGEARTLTVAQPDRVGPGGIWVVTADDPV